MEFLNRVKELIWGEGYDDLPEEGYAEPVREDPSPALSIADLTGAGRVMVFRPSDYVDSGKIVDYLCKGYLIILNLEDADKLSLRRIVDFLSGAAYGRDGQVLHIAEYTFLLVPHGVSLMDGEQLPTQEEEPFQLDAAFGF